MEWRQNFLWILQFRFYYTDLKFQNAKATFVPIPSSLPPYLFTWAKDVLPATSVISSFFLSEKNFCHQEQVCVFSSAVGRAGIVKGRDDSAKDWNGGRSSWFTGLLRRIVFKSIYLSYKCRKEKQLLLPTHFFSTLAVPFSFNQFCAAWIFHSG